MNGFSSIHFQGINDPVKNDDTANIDQPTLDAMWELGGFSIQVPNGRYNCIAIDMDDDMNPSWTDPLLLNVLICRIRRSGS